MDHQYRLSNEEAVVANNLISGLITDLTDRQMKILNNMLSGVVSLIRDQLRAYAICVVDKEPSADEQDYIDIYSAIFRWDFTKELDRATGNWLLTFVGKDDKDIMHLLMIK